MNICLRLFLLIISVSTGYYVLCKIRKSQLQIEDSLFWIIVSVCLIILSIFPNLAIILSKFIGIESPANFVFLVIIFILLIKVFALSIKLSQVEYKLKTLIQDYAIHEKKTISK